ERRISGFTLHEIADCVPSPNGSMLRLILAGLHLLSLGIGLGAVWARARALGAQPLDTGAIRRAFVADSWWGVAAALWIATGLWRLLGSVEKATNYYTHNSIFLMKMDLFGLVFLLELWPMVTLMRWRGASRRGGGTWHPDARTSKWMSV